MDNRANSPENAFTVKQAVDEDYRHGNYPVYYRVFFTDYPDVSVEQDVPFTITVPNPCTTASLTLLPSPFTD